MKTVRLIAVILIISYININLSAENSVKQDNSVLIHCAYSNDEQLQLVALDSLLAKYKQDGSLKKEMIQIPIDLAQEVSTIETGENPIVQLKAIKILGEVGGQDALNGISNLLMSCNNSLILLEAVNSSSQITADDYRYFINALGTVMKQQHSLFKDSGFAYASLSAIDNITKKTGNILTSEVLGIMMVYSEDEYLQKVRDYSRELLNTILTER